MLLSQKIIRKLLDVIFLFMFFMYLKRNLFSCYGDVSVNKRPKVPSFLHAFERKYDFLVTLNIGRLTTCQYKNSIQIVFESGFWIFGIV